MDKKVQHSLQNNFGIGSNSMIYLQSNNMNSNHPMNLNLLSSVPHDFGLNNFSLNQNNVDNNQDAEGEDLSNLNKKK